jgi:hypothetical protein
MAGAATSGASIGVPTKCHPGRWRIGSASEQAEREAAIMNVPIFPPANHEMIPADGRNVFREKFGSLTDKQWFDVLARSVNAPVIDDVPFPQFPSDELQNSIHGNHGTQAVGEAVNFFEFVKEKTYKTSSNAIGKRLLDFGCGWGRMLRPFMRDFDFVDLYGFEPNFQYCALARTLNPYVTFFSGTYVPTGILPGQYFSLALGYSIFSHLSPASAAIWLKELSRIIMPGGWCVITTWGARFLERLKREKLQQDEGKQIHWYSALCISAAGSIDQRLDEYERGEFVWFTSGGSTLYGEAFLGEAALRKLLIQHQIPFAISHFDNTSRAQDGFVLRRL